MDYRIPLEQVPNQEVITNLNGQQCRITIRTINGNAFLSLETDVGIICQNVLCVDRSAIVRAAYTGFVGDLAFVDVEYEEAPQYPGFNTRWLLLYNPAGYPDV